MNYLLPLLLLALAAIGSSRADEVNVHLDELPEAEPSHILDRARIFSPDQLADQSRRLLTLEHQHDISLHIAAYTFLTGESIDDRAIRLKKKWVSNTNGVVIVYVRSTSQISFAASEQFQGTLESTDLMDIFTTAAAKARGALTSETSHYQLITVATDHVAAELVARVGKKIESATEERSYLRVFAVSFGIVLVLLSLGGFAFSRYNDRRRTRNNITHYFPDVVVGQRFGAKHGGGALAEKSF
ncbi:MAG: TPM domain-containing protein [Verrucomicrobiales bacterium]|nr:TPM domain-containing protein [Verrucomicrobiales bacterium]